MACAPLWLVGCCSGYPMPIKDNNDNNLWLPFSFVKPIFVAHSYTGILHWFSISSYAHYFVSNLLNNDENFFFLIGVWDCATGTWCSIWILLWGITISQCFFVFVNAQEFPMRGCPTKESNLGRDLTSLYPLWRIRIVILAWKNLVHRLKKWNFYSQNVS